MANILISHFSSIVDDGRFRSICFFDGLAKGFQDNGHNVKHIISTRFLPAAWNGFNKIYNDIDRDQLAEDIRNFSPDLCIFANNSVPDIAYQVTNCPVIILLSDTANFLNDKEKIKNKKYGDRIYFYAPFKRDLQEIENIFGKNSGKIIHLLPATAVTAKKVPFERNISFIGSNFQNDKRLEKLILEFPDKRRLISIFEVLRRDTSSISFLTEHEKEAIESHFPLSHFPYIFTAKNRILVLALLAEEGLDLFGASNWHETAQYFPDVAASFNPQRIYSLEHNQSIYNSSRVCLNVSHSQALDGFPWRIMDIMASNGCLLSDKKPGLTEFSKGYVNLPLYESPLEAKDLAQRLLKDEIWRKDIVEASQHCIAEKGLWKHRFRDFEEQIGLKLVRPNSSIGTISYMHGEDYTSSKSAPSTRAIWRRGLAKIGRRLAKL